MQQVGPMPRWIAGGALTPPYTMWTGYTPTGTVPKTWSQMLKNLQSGILKSTLNKIQKWEGTWVPRVSNME